AAQHADIVVDTDKPGRSPVGARLEMQGCPERAPEWPADHHKDHEHGDRHETPRFHGRSPANRSSMRCCESCGVLALISDSGSQVSPIASWIRCQYGLAGTATPVSTASRVTSAHG